MMESVERYLAPTTLQQALAVLAAPEGATVLAGGTDLMPQGRAGRVPAARTLLNIRRIAELEGIVVEGGDTLVLGTLTRIADLERDPLVRLHAPLLAEVADHFASAQVRNAATLGGNVCNASPAGDTLPALLALDAEAELARLGPTGAVARRRVPLDAFFAGPGRTRREPGELLVALRMPLAPTPRVTRFYKAGTRPALDISPVAIAFAARRDARGALQGVRLALGAVGPTPLRARRAEALLEGQVLAGPLAAEAAQVACNEATPIDDVRASAWYRRELLRNITRRMLTDVADH
ncbi:xanthine dehydrogenase family protein subunit M [Ramlibacter monticola]|uniref:Xanthine dehydrogenase family protein subunit M n=1 Tax=Ramlibacter monticola TaxID=1926872 RepID=A0A936YXK2_9BURK|nr:xanthine dehydrogenase family protein subunit M [Ramlibacter monticola]MBL0389800.1 xanthine dehydrogenase family protein subunit M [Ramlibacter monticola]